MSNMTSVLTVRKQNLNILFYKPPWNLIFLFQDKALKMVFDIPSSHIAHIILYQNS